MALKIEQLSEDRAFIRVANQIQQNVVDGNIDPGDSLPSEHKLAQMFKASRPTIREALRVLEQRGLVEIKSGAKGGAIITTADGKIAETLNLQLKLKKITLNNIAEFRKNIEPFAAELAVERGNKKDRARLKILKQKVEQIEKKADAQWSDLQPIDSRVHEMIAEMSGNPLISSVLSMMYSNLIVEYDKMFSKLDDQVGVNCLELKNIIDSILNKNKTLAKKRVADHIKNFEKTILKLTNRKSIN